MGEAYIYIRLNLPFESRQQESIRCALATLPDLTGAGHYGVLPIVDVSDENPTTQERHGVVSAS